MASRRTPSTGALESFCEFFSCVQLEYCLREPLSKFEGLSTFYCNFINVNVLYCIYGTFGPFLLYVLRTYNTVDGVSATNPVYSEAGGANGCEISQQSSQEDVYIVMQPNGRAELASRYTMVTPRSGTCISLDEAAI